MAELANAAAAAESRDLAHRLQVMAQAIESARSAGVPVSVPPAVYAACLAVTHLSEATGNGLEALADVPLRKRVLRVIVPGTEFTGSDVAARLAALGVDAPAVAISNVLGFWAASGHLVRIRKGVYLCPVDGSPPRARHEGLELE